MSQARQLICTLEPVPSMSFVRVDSNERFSRRPRCWRRFLEKSVKLSTHMSTLSARSLSWCLVGLFLLLTAAPALADEEEEMRYLFAGMLQERTKLKSWSCAITGQDI